VPGSLVANPALPPKTIKEFIAHAKANPGKLNFGTPGSGSANRLEMEFFMRAAGINMVHVPYKGGAGPAVTGLLGNEVQVMFVTLSSSINFVKQGRLKIFGVVAPRRLAVLPDTPTLAESGFPSMTTGSWQGVFFPVGTPQAIVNKMFDVAQKTMETPEVKKRLNDGGVEVVLSKSPADFAAFVKQQNERWGKVVKDANITAE
jgi:tripartite-type tricarboxylate transporter receptor subunit TctC